MVESNLGGKLKKSVKVMAGPGQLIPIVLSIWYFYILSLNGVRFVC